MNLKCSLSNESGSTSSGSSIKHSKSSSTSSKKTNKLSSSMQSGCHDTANNQFSLEASTSSGVADGSRDTNVQHSNQTQNHYGKPKSRKFSFKLHRTTFTLDSNCNPSSSSSLQINNAMHQTTDMPNIHSLRRSPRGSVKTSNLNASTNVHTSPLAVNASSSGLSISTTT